MNKLDEILKRKQKEVEALIEKEHASGRPLEKILHHHHIHRHYFREALKVAGLAVIAEVKRKPVLNEDTVASQGPVQLAHLYSKAGAAAISIATDCEHYGGALSDLEKIAEGLMSLHPCPILRKEFIIHPYQIAESKKAGASAILLIASVLKSRLKEFMELADYIGLDTLVEIHSEEDLNWALNAGAQIINVNNRDLNTFEVDFNVAKKLASKIPDGIIKVAGSGILTVEDAHLMHEYGYGAVLIDDMLITASDPILLISDIGNA